MTGTLAQDVLPELAAGVPFDVTRFPARRRLLALALGALALARPGAAQLRDPAPDSIYFGGDPQTALRLLESRLARTPDDYEASWKASRAAVSAALLDPDPTAARRTFEAGVAHGENAVRLRPDGIDGLYWLAAATGRLSFLLSPKSAAQAGERTYELANRILALDPANAGAEDALGKIAYRVMRLAGAGRFFARLFLHYDAIRTASWDVAERHLRRAVELDPTWAVTRSDLGDLLLWTGRYEDAARELQAAVDLPVRHPGDRAYQEHAAAEIPYARAGRTP